MKIYHEICSKVILLLPLIKEFALSPFYILIYMFSEMMHGVRGLSCKPNIYVSWSTSELRVRLACLETGLSPPVKYFCWPFQGGASFVDHLCYLCLVFESVHCCLVVTWRERADLLALACDVYCDCVNFPFGILGQVWYLIVLIPDACCLSYFVVSYKWKYAQSTCLLLSLRPCLGKVLLGSQTVSTLP